MSFLLSPLEPHFEAALRDVSAQTPAARIAAAARLGRPDSGREREAEAGLLRLLDDSLPSVRAAALRSLSETGSADAHEPVRAHLEDADPLVRELAVVALGGIDHPQRSQVILAALVHAAPEVRFQAVGIAAEVCPEQAAPHLLSCSRDADDRVREAAARALATVSKRDARATARLRALLDDPADSVRFEAAVALAPGAEPQALDPLLDALTHPEWRFDALEALGHYRHERAVAAVAGLGRRVLVPPAVNAMAGRTLVRMQARALGVACLQDALHAIRSDGRNLAVATIHEYALLELAPELLRLSRWPRGSDPETLVRAAAALAPHAEPARAALSRLARRTDAAGTLASDLLQTVL